MSKKELTHINANGMAQMVDISKKKKTIRIANASATIFLPPSIYKLIDNKEIISAKGPVFNTAIIAGTMAVKNTASIIPFCHSILIENCKFRFEFDALKSEVNVNCEVVTNGKTGSEMEALTGASAACLTIYDMCKAISPLMEIKDIKLMHKSGGKNDFERKK
jgi:cyclic pyranopterin phosphate synthase